MDEIYDPSVNYVKKHIDWILENKTFRPKGGLDRVPNGEPAYKNYEDQMRAVYSQLKDPNRWAHMVLRDDAKYLAKGKEKTVTEEVNIMFGITKKVEYPSFFVTFNFDKNKFEPRKVLVDLGKFMSLSWIQTLHGVFEYHTEHGCHPHLMMVITVNKYSNKIKDKMFESRLKKYCAGTNFIDVKRCKDYHNDYIMLDKSSSKKEYLEKDELWRIENNLPHEIKK